MTEVRLTEAEARGLTPWKIVNTVIYRPFETAPSAWDIDAIRTHLAGVDPILAAVYAAWASASYAVVGEFDVVLLHMSPPLIDLAIKGHELLNQAERGNAIRDICRVFPGGVISLDEQLARDQFDQLMIRCETDPVLQDVFDEFHREPDQIDHLYDFEGLLKKYRNHFVVPNT